MTSSQTSPDNDASGFADRVRSALFWRWGSQVLGQVITWTTTILVVRLLNPQDYGLFAMTQTVLAALNFLNGHSFASSLIRDKNVTERRIGQVFGLLLLSNLALGTLQFLTAPLAAKYYGQPLVADMLRVQSLIYLTTPFIALPSALLARSLEFRRQAWINLTCAVIGAGTALLLAANGFGVWALVWPPVLMFASRGLGLTVSAGALVKPIFDFRGSRDIVTFGGALTLCQMFWIIQSQCDIVIAGRAFDPHDLGLYSEALFLVLIFTGRFLPPLNEVAFPAYAELAHADKPIGPAFISGIRMIMAVAAPFYVGLSLVAGPLVTTFFGPKWLEMIPIVAGLAIAMPAMALQIVCSPATNAMGRPSIYVMTSAAGAIIMPLCFYFGVRFGAFGLVHAWQFAAPLLLLITLTLTLPVVGVRPWAFLKALMPTAVSCATMAAAVRLAGIVDTGLPAVAQLGLYSALGGAVYLGTLWLFWPDFARETLAKLRKRPASAPEPVDPTTTIANHDAA